MPNLKILRISGNNFRELSVANIFFGSQSKNLSTCDLSDNQLEFLPIGMEAIGGKISNLYLRNNELDLQTIYDSTRNYATPTFDIFPSLEHLDLSGNQMRRFTGSLLGNLSALSNLNIGCNKFKTMTKEFFTGLPKSMRLLNLTFCARDESSTPVFSKDVFSTLPPIQRLIMQKGFLKNSVFGLFASADVDDLSELDLSYNSISIMPKAQTVLKPLMNLKILKLRANLFQSLGPRTFQQFEQLRELDISRNRIISIKKDDFAGLYNLKTLTIAGNDITDVESGALDSVPNLEEFYFGENRVDDVMKIFGKNSGKFLRHLGLQELPISCVPASLFRTLTTLKWVYLNSSQSIFLDFGSFRNFHETLKKNPFKLFAFRVPTLEDLGCVAFVEWRVVLER